MEDISELPSVAHGIPETLFNICPSYDLIKVAQTVTAGDFTTTPAKSLKALQNKIRNADITGTRATCRG